MFAKSPAASQRNKFFQIDQEEKFVHFPFYISS